MNIATKSDSMTPSQIYKSSLKTVHKGLIHSDIALHRASAVTKATTSDIRSGLGKAGAIIMASTPNLITPASRILTPKSKYNTFYKIILLVLFFSVFLKVIINIFTFFGIDIVDLYSYMGWVIFLLLILNFIPHDYSTLKLN